jgi:phosphate transport system substrate-binding protein
VNLKMNKSANLQKGKSANKQMSQSANKQISKRAPLPLGLFACLLICSFTLLAACSQTPTPTVKAVHFTLVADTSTLPLVDELVTAYLAHRPHVSIQVEHAANTERALEALRAGQFDLGSVSWLPENEKIGDALWYRPFARDAIVMITHSTNPISGLTLLQLRGIFQWQTLLWEDLGGLALDTIPVSREDGAGTRLSFETLVMGGRDVTPTAVVMPSNEAVVEYVSATPGAIGYVSPAWLVPAVNLLAVEGRTPSPASVEDGRYLLGRPFYLVARAEPSGGLTEFVDWVRDGGGQEIVQRHYASAP